MRTENAQLLESLLAVLASEGATNVATSWQRLYAAAQRLYESFASAPRGIDS